MESLTISTVGRFLRNSIIENFIKNDIEYCPENHEPFDPDFDIPVKVDNVFFKVILVVHSIKNSFLCIADYEGGIKDKNIIGRVNGVLNQTLINLKYATKVQWYRPEDEGWLIEIRSSNF
ncbi:MAG: hypothetical protein NVV82_19825 [Sporocytophaga sp.]|nr:hypothetical protein [Sporocytophaga sp.]